MFSQILPAIRSTIVLAALTGVLFPLAVTGIAQTAWPHQANGSLIKAANGEVVGSHLIGQAFTKPEYFHGRPSAAGNGYDATASGGTNLGPTSAKLLDGQRDDPKTKDVNESFEGIKQLADSYRKENGMAPGALVPVDAVTRSASGLDPHISVANAMLQIGRVAKARKLTPDAVVPLVHRFADERSLGILGEPGVNVLRLNLALDGQEGR